MSDLDLADVLRIADEMAAAIDLLAHDAHPTYANTAGWRGGIGGSMLTTGCSVIDPPPGAEWTQYDLPTGPMREWIRLRPQIDLAGIKSRLTSEWMAQLFGPRATGVTEGGEPRG